MRNIICIAASLVIGACAQTLPTITLGSATDPCVGGATWATPTLRYGSSFTCTVAVAPGLYRVALTFSEPTYSIAGKRIFNVTLNGYAPASMHNLDLAAIGLTTVQATATITEPVMTQTSGTISIQLTSVLSGGNAVLSGITVMPAIGQSTPGPQGPAGEAGPKGDPGPVGPTGPAPVTSMTSLPCTYPAQPPTGVPPGTSILMAQLGDGTCLPLLLIPPPVSLANGLANQDGSFTAIAPGMLFVPQRQ